MALQLINDWNNYTSPLTDGERLFKNRKKEKENSEHITLGDFVLSVCFYYNYIVLLLKIANT